MKNPLHLSVHRGSFFAVAALALFLVITQFGLPALHRREIFPFFQWHLFREASPRRAVYVLLIEREGQGGLCRWEDCPDLPPRARNKRLFFVLQDLGHAGFPTGEVHRFEARLSRMISGSFRYQIAFSEIHLPLRKGQSLPPPTQILHTGTVTR